MPLIQSSERIDLLAVGSNELQGTRTENSGRIVVAEDDAILSRFLRRMLEAEGFEVDLAEDGETALSKLRSHTDLLLLDLSLPKLDGIGVVTQVRLDLPQLPVLVLTGRSRTEQTVEALESGADDCLTKPFAYTELLARIRALLRRIAAKPQNESRCGDLVLRRDQLRVRRGERKIDLTQREFGLLEYLMRSPGMPVSRATLLQEVWGSGYEPTTNVVDVYMKYVRDKVDVPGFPKLIRTVRGTGYVVSET